MKALTLTCPWAHAVAHWGKTIENRTWLPPRELFGQRLAIHAGKSPFRELKSGAASIGADAEDELHAALDFARRASGLSLVPPAVTRRWLHDRSSAILCVATVAGWVRESGEYDLVCASPRGVWGHAENKAAADAAIASPWFVGPYGWVLTDVVTLATPVPCAGKQGLWALPPDVEAAVMGQVNHGR